MQIHFSLPSKTKSESDICWTNLITSDSIWNLEIFSASVAAWRRLNPTLTYKDLEDELRRRGANTHIIAVENNGPIKYELGHFGGDPSIKYQYWPLISCRPKELALLELMKYHSSYESNYEKLDKAGDIMMKRDDEKANSENVTMLFKNRLFHAIRDCKTEMTFVGIGGFAK